MNSPIGRRGFLKRSLLAAAGLAVAPRNAAAAATLVRYPYLQNVRSDRATIMWATLEKGSGSVRYSSDFSFSRTVPASIREFLPSQTDLSFTFYQYQAELTGLNSATEYFCQVVVDGGNLTPQDDLRFRTAGPNPFNFLAFGDSGGGTPEQRFLAARMLVENPSPDLVLHTGDIAYCCGTFSQFQERYFDVYRDLMKRVPFFPSPGNHEYDTTGAEPYLAMHGVPTENVPVEDRGRYYSFDWGNMHFIALDANLLLLDPVAGTARMLEWLDKDLQKTRLFWRVVYFHQPPYASGVNERDPISERVRQQVVPILDRYDVPLVLNGHEHSYQRSYPLRGGTVVGEGTGTVYITTGGGGGALYPVFSRPFLAAAQSIHHYVRAEVRDTRMTLRAILIDGRQIDSVTLAPVPLISAGSPVNAASFTPFFAPGGLVSIFGRNLAGAEATASAMPLPKELAGTTVTLNGVLLPLLYVSRSQINAQLPFGAQGSALLRVATANGSTDAVIPISEAAAAIFSVAGGSGVLPAITHANGELVSPQAPAESGEQVSVYLTGLGAVNGEIEAGQPAPVSPLLQARLPVRVEMGSSLLVPSYAGLAPGFAGLYQVNVQIPANLPEGTYTVRITVGTVSRSNPVSLIVRSAGSAGISGSARLGLPARGVEKIPLTGRARRVANR